MNEKKINMVKAMTKAFKVIGHRFYLALKIFFVMVVSTLAGMQSRGLIYTLNKPLGLGYALYASYAETALIAAALSLYMFNSQRKK